MRAPPPPPPAPPPAPERSRASATRLRAFLLACAALTAGGSTCVLAEPDPDLHQWGRYQLCLEKRLDTCDRGDAGCPALDRDDTRAASLRLHKSTSVLEIVRDGTDASTGIQGGARFEFTGAPTAIDAQCGCWMSAVETIQGEFVGTAETCASAASDAGTARCVSLDEADDGGWAEGVQPGWVTEGEAIDFDTVYDGVAGRVVVELTPIPDGGTCRCGPCRIEYALSGRR